MWNELHNEEFHSVYGTLNIIYYSGITRGMRWVDYVNCVGVMRNATKLYSENFKRRGSFEDLSIDEYKGTWCDYVDWI